MNDTMISIRLQMPVAVSRSSSSRKYIFIVLPSKAKTFTHNFSPVFLVWYIFTNVLKVYLVFYKDRSVIDGNKRQNKSDNEVKIFITEKTGVGKSTLVNGLMGKQMVKEGDTLDPETSVVKGYKTKHRSVYVTVWDLPGLQDGTNNESEYLGDMKKQCSDMDLSIYCVSLKETRFFKGCADTQ